MIHRLGASLVRTAIPSVRRPINYSRHLRPFSSTPLRTIEDLPAFSAAFKKTQLFKKLANHPGAVNAIRGMMETMQEAGVDVSSGVPPSKIKMAKLLMNSKFRDQVKLVAEEMQKADVDLTSKEVMEEIMALKNAGGSSK